MTFRDYIYGKEWKMEAVLNNGTKIKFSDCKLWINQFEVIFVECTSGDMKGEKWLFDFISGETIDEHTFSSIYNILIRFDVPFSDDLIGIEIKSESIGKFRLYES